MLLFATYRHYILGNCSCVALYPVIAAPLHPYSRDIRPPRMAGVQKMHDYMDVGGKTTQDEYRTYSVENVRKCEAYPCGTSFPDKVEEQFSTRTSCT